MPGGLEDFSFGSVAPKDAGGGSEKADANAKVQTEAAQQGDAAVEPFVPLPEASDTRRTIIVRPGEAPPFPPGSPGNTAGPDETQRTVMIRDGEIASDSVLRGGGGPTAEDIEFSNLVRRSRLATDAEIDECFDIISTITSLGVKKSLADVMVEKGYLSAPQATAIAFAIKKGQHGGLVGGFQLLNKIGEGGMGEVYKARQVSLDRIVAVKLLPERLASNPEFVGRFEREARSAAKLSHPNIVGAVDVGKAAGKYFFAMEFVDGDSIESLLERDGKMEESHALDIILQAAHGLEFAWRNSIVHRDIKPDNIMLTKDGVAKIADLGLARETGTEEVSRLTQANTVMGSPHYMSPEQAYAHKDVDTRSDIYSLGITLYKMVTGELPFKGADPMAIIQARFQGPVTPANEIDPDVSVGLAQVINVMMALKADDRYPDPRVLIHDLRLVAEGKAPEYASPDKAKKARAVSAAKNLRNTTSIVIRRSAKKRSKLTIVMAVAGVLLLAAGGAAVFTFVARPNEAELEEQHRVEDVQREAKASAKLDELNAAAQKVYDEVSPEFEAGNFDEVSKRLTELGTKYSQTEYGGKLDAMKMDSMRKSEEKRRLAQKEAENEKRYADLVKFARSELEGGNYAAAMPLLVQAKSCKDTPEVAQLMQDAKRIRLMARAVEAERVGDPGEAAKQYELALEIEEDAATRDKLVEIRRQMSVTERVAKGDDLAAEGRFAESKTAYTEAAAVARGQEKPPIKAKIETLQKELDYVAAIGEAKDAAAVGEWKQSMAHAEAALALKPADNEASRLIESAKDELGPESTLTDSIGMKLLLVPGGEFLMGSATGEEDERPPRQVKVDAFYIGLFEVTNAQFEQFNVGHRTKWKKFSPSDDMPAIAVTWEEAVAFCKWLSEKEGANYRLPTEAEWELAARGEQSTVYPWGNEAPDAGGRFRCNYAPVKDRAQWSRDGYEFVAPVGSYPDGRSAYGCMDMAGNVWEWCSDWYSADYYRRGGATNPAGPQGGTERVLRGGSLTDRVRKLRTTNRLAKPPTFFEANVGFRCVREVRKRGAREASAKEER